MITKGSIDHLLSDLERLAELAKLEKELKEIEDKARFKAEKVTMAGVPVDIIDATIDIKPLTPEELKELYSSELVASSGVVLTGGGVSISSGYVTSSGSWTISRMVTTPVFPAVEHWYHSTWTMPAEVQEFVNNIIKSRE